MGNTALIGAAGLLDLGAWWMLRNSEVAAMLPPMPVSPSLVMSYRRESDEAMRLALECGVAGGIASTYGLASKLAVMFAASAVGAAYIAINSKGEAQLFGRWAGS